VRLYDRALLRPGTTFAGPALAFQMDSTVFVPPAWSVRVDGYHSLVLEYSQCL
jgi:N-methylhydantoinase A/oxoprolinase/acetone carboxylase beta subunit